MIHVVMVVGGKFWEFVLWYCDMHDLHDET